MSPYDSDDLTEVIKEEAGEFVVLESPETAERYPDYRELGRFRTQADAKAFLANL